MACLSLCFSLWDMTGSSHYSKGAKHFFLPLTFWRSSHPHILNPHLFSKYGQTTHLPIEGMQGESRKGGQAAGKMLEVL